MIWAFGVQCSSTAVFSFRVGFVWRHNSILITKGYTFLPCVERPTKYSLIQKNLNADRYNSGTVRVKIGSPARINLGTNGKNVFQCNLEIRSRVYEVGWIGVVYGNYVEGLEEDGERIFEYMGRDFVIPKKSKSPVPYGYSTGDSYERFQLAT